MTAALIGSPAFAQDDGAARELLERAAQAMGGLERIRSIDNLVMTGFGQRYAANGMLSADPHAPPKWEVVADAERSFDLANERALNRERNDNMFPFAARFGHAMNRSNELQTGVEMLNHPLPAVLEALDAETVLGPVRIEDGAAVVEFTIEDGATVWLGIDTQTSLPYWFRWVTGDGTLGDLTHTAYFTGYLPHDGVWLPTGLKENIDWRGQTTLMFQVDSYRLDVEALPEFPAAAAMPPTAAPNVVVEELSDGVWDVAVVRGQRRDGGAVVEFSDHLVMFEPYGSESATLARIDAANRLVRGKEVTAVIVSHHHSDHAGGVRAVASRGITLIGHRRTQEFFEEWVERPAVLFPDELARNPQPLKFMPVDERLVLEDSTRRLEVYHVVGHMHMSDALFAYLPEERIIMEGDFTDNTWDFNWWAGALQANIERYGLEPEIDVPVHGAVSSVSAKLERTAEQVANAQAFCAELAANGRYLLGCPVQHSIRGPL
ncbi:MAG TPA: MBL fold metallo-hydrolase [Gammaproteobacteria bacterium]|nr:MBL fold metallo-hydrolase [Gammaproteobacteria bacterium]